MAIDVNKNYYPAMPVTHDPQEHRDKLAEDVFPFNAVVARAVPKRRCRTTRLP